MGFFTGKKATQGTYIRDDYGTLNPEQKAGVKTLGPELINRAMVGTPQYTGQYTAPLSPEEQNIQANQSRMNALTQRSFEDLMSGKFPEQYYQDAVYKPMLKQFQEDTQPALEEQYAGSGYWGSARANAVSKGYRDLNDTMIAERAKLAKEARELPLTASGAYSSYMQNAQNIAQIPRDVQQLGLDKQYQEWIRTRPENTEYINAALEFLNINTVTNTYQPGRAAEYGLFDYMEQGAKQHAYDVVSGDKLTKNLSAFMGGSPQTGQSLPGSGQGGNYNQLLALQKSSTQGNNLSYS